MKQVSHLIVLSINPPKPIRGLDALSMDNSKNELIPQRTVTGWRMCIDYRKLNKATKKYHFLLPFIDEMFKHLAKDSFYFLDVYSHYHQIPIHTDDQSETTFTCPLRNVRLSVDVIR